ncbi:hypothetical protein CHCC15291_3492 [Bacillus licheniformis]|nr:hypothetical protein CHCC20493_2347 [Bacillus licheniformis]TWK16980.1 hypothetical protein CHCC20373_1000 [Bacillus licheniformis]TWK90992.1 hypothetical protein CHCC20327_2369 [Bacillus licheniformis]TWL23247.1 hypothetical protein CHCC16874_4229 [Bacillus licheniformis]TWL70310.1 hypothetical protein CHCC15318_2844 [Bacillus licheniformis]
MTTPLFDQQTVLSICQIPLYPLSFCRQSVFHDRIPAKMKALTFSIIATISQIDKSFLNLYEHYLFT